MIILWNEDGTLKTFVNNEAVNQHSNRVNFVQFAFDGHVSSASTGDVIFTLPNGDILTKVATPKEFIHLGKFYQGFEVAITDDVTLLSGTIKAVCRVLGNAQTLYSYQFDILVNETIAKAFKSNQLDQNQYDQILHLLTSYAERYDPFFIRKYESLALAQADKEIQDGAVVMVLTNGEYLYYQKRGGSFFASNYKGFEDLAKATPTDLKVRNVEGSINAKEIGLAHDGTFLIPQQFIQFKSINDKSIIGAGNLETSTEVKIVGHNGTFTQNEMYFLSGRNAYIYDIDDDVKFFKIRNNLYCAITFDSNDVIRVWACKIDTATRNWTLESSTLALRGEVHEPKAITLVNARETATNGTLTNQEYIDLTTDQNSFIYFNKEKYNLADNMHNIGSMTYTHLGYENNVFVLKAITITLANKTWVLNEKELI